MSRHGRVKGGTGKISSGGARESTREGLRGGTGRVKRGDREDIFR